MGTRTIQIQGCAYSETGDVSIVCNFNGVEVHNGTITTVNGSPTRPHTAITSVTEFQIDDTIFGITVPSTIAVTNGTVFISGIAGDKSRAADLSAFKQSLSTTGSEGLTKTNVTIDGVLIDAVQPLEGWHYEVADGSTIAIDWFLGTPYPTLPGNPGPVGNIVIGVTYKIVTAGDTDFTTAGSADSIVGTTFTATSIPTGTGTVVVDVV